MSNPGGGDDDYMEEEDQNLGPRSNISKTCYNCGEVSLSITPVSGHDVQSIQLAFHFLLFLFVYTAKKLIRPVISLVIAITHDWKEQAVAAEVAHGIASGQGGVSTAEGWATFPQIVRNLLETNRVTIVGRKGTSREIALRQETMNRPMQ